MQRTCLEHSEGKLPKIKSADLAGAKHKAKAASKEEAKLAKSEVNGAPVSPSKAKAEAKAQKKAEKEEKRAKRLAEKQNGIKKPLSAYMLYCNHRRPIIMKESPGKCR